MLWNFLRWHLGGRSLDHRKDAPPPAYTMPHCGLSICPHLPTFSSFAVSLHLPHIRLMPHMCHTFASHLLTCRICLTFALRVLTFSHLPRIYITVTADLPHTCFTLTLHLHHFCRTCRSHLPYIYFTWTLHLHHFCLTCVSHLPYICFTCASHLLHICLTFASHLPLIDVTFASLLHYMCITLASH